VTVVRPKGFSLIELVVVVLIVALLLTLMLPSYQRQLWHTRRSIGGAALQEAMMRQEQYFIDHKHYAETLTDLDFPAHPFAINPEGAAVDVLAADRIYLIELTTREYGYTLFAAPQLGQTADTVCGTLSLDSTGIKRAAGNGSPRDCW
jgi:type IV pilus assembly protein PilE